MTEKRFTLENEELQFGIKDNGKYITVLDAVNRLNELNDENKQLKKELEMFKPVMFKDMRKGTVILYRKGDVE